jgi:hypothetical protein
MSKFMLALMAVTMFACSSCAHVDGGPRPNTFDQPGVARVQMFDENFESDGKCTAWKVADDLVVTAGHCCTKGKTYILQGPYAVPGTEAHVLVDLKEDDDDGIWTHDICVMRGRLRGKAIKLAKQDPPIGAHIWTLGYPHGTFLISEGIWSGRNEEGAGVCSSVARGGASGSPILDANSNAVGVLVATWTDADNITLVASLERLRMAVRKARLSKEYLDE